MGVVPPESMTTGWSPQAPVKTCCKRSSTSDCSCSRPAKRRRVKLASISKILGPLAYGDGYFEGRAVAQADQLDLGARLGAGDPRQDVLRAFDLCAVESGDDVTPEQAGL